MSTQTANDLLMGSGVKSASFLMPGTVVTGRIVNEPKVQQQTDAKDGSPKFFANGDPMMQIVVHVQTDERADSDDDGVRAVYVKSNMLKAVREAVKATGAKGLEVGGTLTVTYTGDGEKANAKLSAPKLYTATYRPPAGEAANAILMGGTPAAAAPSAQAPTPATAAAPSDVPAGVDPGVWSRLNPAQRAQVLAGIADAPADKPPF